LLDVVSENAFCHWRPTNVPKTNHQHALSRFHGLNFVVSANVTKKNGPPGSGGPSYV
jgi:hypothetical protein